VRRCARRILSAEKIRGQGLEKKNSARENSGSGPRKAEPGRFGPRPQQYAYAGCIAKFLLKYPRYQPTRLRPAGTGAFFDYAESVTLRETRKLKSCSLQRRWGKAPAPVEPTEA
jgi:hypothetical protein